MTLHSAAISLSTSESGVSNKCVQYLAMERNWLLPEALLMGTLEMRRRGQAYLPQNERETQPQYDARILRSFLFNAYSDTIQKLADKPFQKAIILENAEELPEDLKPIQFDVDFSGRDIDDFAKDIIEDAAVYGLTHVLVDFPRTGGAATLKEEREKAARPSFIHISARDMIGWSYEDNEDGVSELSMIRYVEQSIEPDGDYCDKIVIRVRVWTRTTWELWEETETVIKTGDKSTTTKDWSLTDEGENTLGYIPLRTLYFKRIGDMVAAVPLEDLAWVNLEHWQSSSEQRNILHIVRIATLFAKGFTEDEIKNGITISAHGMVATVNNEADLKWVEHNGNALSSGAEDLENLENRMEVLGLQPHIQKASASTATVGAISEGRANTKIKAWIRSTENLLVQCYVIGADWIKKKAEMPEDFRVNIFNDFGISIRDEAELATLTAARLAGEIDHKTYINELRRRGVLSEAVDAESIDAELEEETGDNLKDQNENFIDDNTDHEDENNEDGEISSHNTDDDNEGGE